MDFSRCYSNSRVLIHKTLGDSIVVRSQVGFSSSRVDSSDNDDPLKWHMNFLSSCACMCVMDGVVLLYIACSILIYSGSNERSACIHALFCMQGSCVLVKILTDMAILAQQNRAQRNVVYGRGTSKFQVLAVLCLLDFTYHTNYKNIPNHFVFP